MLQTGESAEALAAAFGDLLRGVDRVGNKSTLDALPAVLDLDVPVTYQFEDVPREIYERLWNKKQGNNRSGTLLKKSVSNKKQKW